MPQTLGLIATVRTPTQMPLLRLQAQGLYRVKRIVHTQKDIPPSCDLPAPIIDLVPPESYWKSL